MNTRIQLAQRQARGGTGARSLGRFSERRVGRLVPALFATFSATLVARYRLAPAMPAMASP